MMLYRNRNIKIDEKLHKKYILEVHAPVEPFFIDCAIHRIYGTDVSDDSDIENYSDQEIEAAVISCMEEDILAVELKKGIKR